MRGIIGSAAAVAVDQLNMTPVFDAMYGTSAGALTVSYLAAGQIALGTSIYYQNLAGHKHFIDKLRLSGPMDIGFLFDQWITQGKALDAQAVIDSPVRVGVATTDAGNGKTRIFDNRELDPAEFVSAVRASTSMPLFANNIETIRGRQYNDGFLAASLPIEAAVSDGCSHMLVLPTSTPRFRDSIGLLEHLYGVFRLSDYSVEFRSAFRRRAELYNELVEQLYGDGFGVPTMVIAPQDADTVPDNGETDPDVLIAAGEASLRRIERVFGAPAGSTQLFFAPEGMRAFAAGDDPAARR